MTELEQESARRILAARWSSLQAGRLTWDHFERGVVAEMKRDNTPVTVADRAAEELLRDQFKKAFPGDGFLGEEYGEEASTSGFRWIIDPIDGTKNFVRGIPFFATLIGLEFNGQMVGGVVYIPAMNRMYYASKGQGAFCNDRRLSVSRIDTLAKSQVIYTSLEWFTKSNKTDAYLRLVHKVERTRGFGDFWGFLMVAEGSVEIAVEPDMQPWDVAAVQPIVEEAGGTFTDWTGKPTVYGMGAIATNGKVHQLVMDTLNQA